MAGLTRHFSRARSSQIVTQRAFTELYPVVPSVALAPASGKKLRQVDRVAAFFRARPLIWLDGLDVGRRCQCSYAWRTRISDLRAAPFNMVIEQRERDMKDDETGEDWTVSEYRWVP